MSGFTMSVKGDLKQIAKHAKATPKAIAKATVRATNRTIKQVETVAVREISKETGIKPQRKVRERLRIQKASRNRMIAILTAIGYALNLIEFVTPAKRIPGAFKKKPGVRAKAWGKQKTYPHTFIVQGKNSGKPVVVSRKPGVTGQRANWSKTIYGPSIPKTFIERRVASIMQRTGHTQWRKNFERDLKYYMSLER